MHTCAQVNRICDGCVSVNWNLELPKDDFLLGCCLLASDYIGCKSFGVWSNRYSYASETMLVGLKSCLTVIIGTMKCHVKVHRIVLQATAVVKKKTNSQVTKEFNPAFSFEDNFADTGFSYDPLRYAKKKRQLASTLDEKIFQARAERKKKSQVLKHL